MAPRDGSRRVGSRAGPRRAPPPGSIATAVSRSDLPAESPGRPPGGRAGPRTSARPTMAPTHPSRRTASRSSMERMPPDAITRPVRGARPARAARDPAPETAVPADGRDLERVDAGRQDPFDRVGDGRARRARTPALAHRVPVADIERHRDPTRPMPLRRAGRRGRDPRARSSPRRPGRPPRRAGASHRPRGAAPRRSSTRRRSPTAATIRATISCCCGEPVARPVEVHDVDPARRRRRRSRRDRRRVVAVPRLRARSRPRPERARPGRRAGRSPGITSNPSRLLLPARLDVAHRSIVVF